MGSIHFMVDLGTAWINRNGIETEWSAQGLSLCSADKEVYLEQSKYGLNQIKLNANDRKSSNMQMREKHLWD